jgi:thiol-disulfide isomerase/thioredoxin
LTVFSLFAYLPLNGYIFRTIMTIQDIMPRRMQARELLGDYWLNGRAVSLADLRGQVVLLDFWDFTSSASLRTLPYVLAWAERYRLLGLTVIGVHVPRFAFGQDPERIARALRRLGIGFPVVMDNSQLIWTQYSNRVWPTKHLVDVDGFIRCQSIGEGGYGPFERSLQHLLHEAHPLEDLPDLLEPLRETDRQDAVCYRATPEILAGYLRGSIGNVEGCVPESVIAYADPGIYMDGRIYVQGAWRNERECIRWEGASGEEGALFVRYRGSEVNLVVDPGGTIPVDVRILQDGRPLTKENMGEDIRLTASGDSLVRLDGPRLYNITRNRLFGDYLLRLQPASPGFALYSVTGVTAVIPELFGNN